MPRLASLNGIAANRIDAKELQRINPGLLTEEKNENKNVDPF